MASATRALLGFGLLLLSACGLEAQTVTRSGKPLENVAGPECSPEQRLAVDNAMAEARRRMAMAIRFIEQRPNDPHVVRWFGQGQSDLARKNLTVTLARANRPESIRFQCNDPQTCARGPMGYTRRQSNIVGVCAPFFRAGNEGQDNRWGILIHELTHLAAGTGDHAYQPRGAQALAKEDPARAARNADNYEYFVEFLPN